MHTNNRLGTRRPNKREQLYGPFGEQFTCIELTLVSRFGLRLCMPKRKPHPWLISNASISEHKAHTRTHNTRRDTETGRESMQRRTKGAKRYILNGPSVSERCKPKEQVQRVVICMTLSRMHTSLSISQKGALVLLTLSDQAERQYAVKCDRMKERERETTLSRKVSDFAPQKGLVAKNQKATHIHQREKNGFK